MSEPMSRSGLPLWQDPRPEEKAHREHFTAMWERMARFLHTGLDLLRLEPGLVAGVRQPLHTEGQALLQAVQAESPGHAQAPFGVDTAPSPEPPPRTLWQRVQAWFSRLRRVLSPSPAAEDWEQQMSNLTQELRAFKQEVRTELTVLKSDVTVLKDDVTILKDDVTILKDDVAVLKDDVAVLKDDMKGVKSDVAILKDDMKGVKSELKILTQGQAALQQGQENLQAEARGRRLEENVRHTMASLVRAWMPDEMRPHTRSTMLIHDRSSHVAKQEFLQSYCEPEGSLRDSRADPLQSDFVQAVWTGNGRRQQMHWLVVGEVALSVDRDDAARAWARAEWLRTYLKAPFRFLPVVPLVVGMRDLHTVADYADGRLPLLQVATDYEPLSMTMQAHHLAPWPDAGMWRSAMTHWQVGRWAPN